MSDGLKDFDASTQHTNRIRPAPWIAARSYCVDTPESRSFISNERTHEHLLLTGESSDMWARISDGTDLPGLVAYARGIGLDGELDGFIKDLEEAMLVLNDDADDIATAFPIPDPAINDGVIKVDSIEKGMMDWAWENGFLWYAQWEMTHRCNQRCLHCFNPGAALRRSGERDRGDRELTTEEAFSMIDDMVAIGVFRLSLSGGEATLRKDFLDILRYARLRGLCVDISTNALEWDDDFIGRIAVLWPHQVGVSVYSADPALHDMTTGIKGSFHHSVSVLRRLNERGIKTNMKSVQMRHTIQGYDLTRQLGASLGAATTLDMSLIPGFDGDVAPLDHQIENFGELVVLAATPGSPLFVGGPGDNRGHRASTLEKDKQVCGAGWMALNIDPVGMVFPCTALPLMVGTVRGHGLGKIWSESLSARRHEAGATGKNKVPGHVRGSDLLAEWQAIRLSDYNECGDHDHCAFCWVCPGKSLLETGDLLAASAHNCRQARACLTAAELMESGLSRDEICGRFQILENFGKQHAISGTCVDPDGAETRVTGVHVDRKAFDPADRARLTILERIRSRGSAVAREEAQLFAQE